MEKIEIKLPLVSIIIITYNSAKYVLETLESVKAQTYSKIELIISDDGSSDDTTEICRKWLDRNEIFFINTKLIQVSKNTGIPSNVNRGVNEAKGEWIKLIAGDDILLNSCISDNVNFVVKNSQINFLFSKPIYINGDSEIMNMDNFKKIREDDIFYKLEARQQYLHLLTMDHPLKAPSLFYKKIIVDDLGGFDENFKNEDYPLYLKATKAGFKMYFNNVESVKYRKHESSYSQIIRENRNAISNWNFKKLRETIIPQIDKELLLKNPLVVIDIYNKLFMYNLVILFGNSQRIKNNLSFIRWFSPLVISRKFRSNYLD